MWQMTWVLDNQVKPLLDQGWEPFGVVLNPITADVIVYLKKDKTIENEENLLR